MVPVTSFVIGYTELIDDTKQMAAWEFQALQNVADKHGWHKFISMQNFYNLIYREEGKLSAPPFWITHLHNEY